MKKDKKKGTNKKTWVVDCRTDSAFDFALRVLKEADNTEYPIKLRANFIKIAYDNTCETIAKAQTDPHNYKMKSAFKLFVRNIKCIFDKCSAFYGYDDINDYRNENVIDNPFDYISIDYDTIELGFRTLKNLTLQKDVDMKYERNRAVEMVKDSIKRYSYPKIYEKKVIPAEGDKIAEILPTNDIIVYLPFYVVNIFEETDGVGEFYVNNNKFKTDAFLSLITGESFKNGEFIEINEDFPSKSIPKPTLIHVPNDSFENISDLIASAATYPENVKKICITAYRLGRNSSIIDSIITATNNRIECKLYIELSARGESAQDLIYLTKLLDHANHEYLDIKVRYNGIKVHGKMVYVELEKSLPIGVFSTGNYNASTALVYKDYHYVSCERSVTDMIKRNFSVLWNSDQPVLSSISNILTNEIYEEIAKGKNGKIWMQTNHLDNKLIVSLLKEAIRRGCDVKLIVRTTKGFHNRELKNCKTVVGKYLEHSRVYIFGDGKNRRVYLSSSDILFRNLYNRFESYIKITDSDIEDELVKDFRELYKNGQRL